MMNEFKFIEIATSIFKRRRKDVIAGAGDDDCAVVKFGDSCLVFTTDSLHEKTDFPEIMTPEEIGHMALAVNLSDLAGSGAKPEYFLFDITLREGIDEGFFTGILSGIEKLAEKYNVEVVGGDIDFGDELYITGFAIGVTKNPRLLSGASEGENVYITGTTGKAELGLEKYFEGLDRNEIPFVQKLLTPEPKIEDGLRISTYAGAMTDISDSLAISLHNISRKSNVGIVLEEDLIDLGDLLEFVNYDKALRLFLYGGGDFELTYTASEDVEDKDMLIGKVIDGKGVWVKRRDGRLERIEFKGYSHF
jgi:thiamine-monophosphate kinase